MDNILEFLAHGLLFASYTQIVWFTLLVTHITIASVTIYLHRHQAHRALELHPVISHFFRFWLWLTTAQVTKEWTAIHRKHHAKCETIDDPHSPQVKGLSTVLLTGAELYAVASKDKACMERYGHGTPNDWLENNVYARHSFVGIFILLSINIVLFGTLGLTVWAVQMAWIPVMAAGVINGVGHYIGYRNYDSPDAARNILPWGILIGGEELHNNHHTYASSAKLSSKWYEIDIGWFYIRTLEVMRLAKVKKLAPKPRFTAAPVEVNGETVTAVVTNRYEILARYKKIIQQAYRAEVRRLYQAGALDRKTVQSYKLQTMLATSEKVVAPEAVKLLHLSPTLTTLFSMREELSTLWTKSHTTIDALASDLNDWCRRAEGSGIASLAMLSHRLRTYG